MHTLLIRTARPAELALLVRELGDRPFFVDRFARQGDGRGLLLVAWSDDRPVGVVYLWWEPAEEPELRLHLPGTPLLTHLEVHADHRARGTGSALIAAAERELVRRGHTAVALAVEVGNDGAARLYRRLGYAEWDQPPIRCYSLTDGNGQRAVEICRILVKPLPP
ncbi:GNAT family N-acetyltransferase [Actinophytocola gossypii]|uniref:GNAT family N-acetyltransferase n=1 Tax=Actinophytocola gossypii TaxID=2812003 RepID=A0ABT2J153_9PSEU|nr:GNAT family N-acetyltransferase [Actinophytocola gossypii]MCT2581538.1 GNAT family N-acetyltransferase [Actinophytocola gossypii]